MRYESDYLNTLTTAYTIKTTLNNSNILGINAIDTIDTRLNKNGYDNIFKVQRYGFASYSRDGTTAVLARIGDNDNFLVNIGEMWSTPNTTIYFKATPLQPLESMIYSDKYALVNRINKITYEFLKAENVLTKTAISGEDLLKVLNSLTESIITNIMNVYNSHTHELPITSTSNTLTIGNTDVVTIGLSGATFSITSGNASDIKPQSQMDSTTVNKIKTYTGSPNTALINDDYTEYTE